MSDLRFILNGTTLNNHPDGWEAFTESLELDMEVYGFVLKYEGNLTFVGDGYKLLNDLWEELRCDKIPIVVDQNCGGAGWVNAFTGILSITDVDYNLHKCTAEVKTTDSSWFGKIHNDRQIPINLESQLAKDGTEISACPSVELRVFDPSQDVSGGSVSYSGTTRKAYDHRDALAYCLSFVTGGEINTVVSDYLDGLAWDTPPEDVAPDFTFTDMSFFIVRGLTFRTGNDTAALTTTIEDILDTLHKKYNLYWRISGGEFRIEPIQYWKGQPNKEYLDQPDLVRSVDTSMLYAKVAVGSEVDLPDNKVQYSVPFVEFISHDVQEWALDYECNTDTIYDLVSKLIYSSNVFEKMLVEDEQDNDQDNCYVQAVYVPADDQWRAVYSTFFVRPDGDDEVGICYNPYLFNDVVLRRHILPAGMFVYEAGSDDNFKAVKTGMESVEQQVAAPPVGAHFSFFGPNQPTFAQWMGDLFGNNAFGIDTSGGIFDTVKFPNSALETNIITPVEYSDDSFDPNGNWSDTLYEFTAPATGLYGFTAHTIVNKVYDLVKSQLLPDEIQIGLHPMISQTYLQDTKLDVKCSFERYDAGGNLTNIFVADNVLDTPEFFTPSDGAGQPIREYPTSGSNFGNTFGGLPPTYNSYHYKNAQFIPQSWDNPLTYGFDGLIYMLSGHKMKVRIEIGIRSHFAIDKYKNLSFSGDTYRRVGYGILPGSYIETNYIRTGGADFRAIDPDLAYNLELDFDRPLTLQEWNEIKADPSRAIKTGVRDSVLQGYVKRLKRTYVTGQTEFVLNANRSDNL